MISLDNGEIELGTLLGCYLVLILEDSFTHKIIEVNQISVIIKVFFIPSLCSLLSH